MSESNDRENEIARLKQRMAEIESQGQTDSSDTDKFETGSSVADTGQSTDKQIDAALNTSQKTIITK